MSASSKLEYGSYLDYSSHGTGVESIRSQKVCYTIKQNGFFDGQVDPAIDYAVGRLLKILPNSCLADFFGPKTALVPCPRSSLLQKGSLYPSKIACDCLAQIVGCKTSELLERVVAVPKAATALKGKRPTVRAHMESMRVNTDALGDAKTILLVDDVVTRGTMFLASASLLSAAFPKVKIRAFALVRTISPGEVDKIENPSHGIITPFFEHAHRRP